MDDRCSIADMQSVLLFILLLSPALALEYNLQSCENLIPVSSSFNSNLMGTGQFGSGQMSPGQVGPGQFGSGQMGPGQLGPGQLGPGQMSPGQVGPGQFGSGQMGPGQLGPGQVGPGQFGSGQMGPGQLGPGQLGPGQLGPGQLGPGQLGPGQLGPGQLGPGQLGPGQFGPGQLGLGQMSPGQMSPGQFGANQNPNFNQGGSAPNSPPMLMTTLTPYRITLTGNRYSSGRVLEVRLEGQDYFDGFMMEARGMGGGPSNIMPMAGIGRWVGIPAGATFLNCRGRPYSAVASVGPSMRTNSLNFTWESPASDAGEIYFIASVVVGNRYWIFTSERLIHRRSPYPGEITGCGTLRTCVRLCGENPLCTLENAEYVLIIEISPGGFEAIITLGGRVSSDYRYISFGMAEFYYSVRNMDMNVCMKEQGQVMLGHYFVKSEFLPPFPHIGLIVPDATDIDNDYIWCRFRRPLLSFGDNSIDPTKAMYHYYFKGPKNHSGIYLPPIKEMNISPYPHNITMFYNDVQISNVGSNICFEFVLIYFVVASTILQILC